MLKVLLHFNRIKTHDCDTIIVGRTTDIVAGSRSSSVTLALADTIFIQRYLISETLNMLSTWLYKF